MNRKTVLIISSASIAIAVLLFSLISLFTKNEDNEISMESSDYSTEVSETSTPIQETSSVHGWVINRMGYTYLYKDRGLQQFNGTTRTALRYADIINKITKKILADNSYSIIVPTQAEFTYIPSALRKADNFFCTSQSEAIFTTATATENIKDIDITDLINAHSDEYLYFRTDPNWTALGAYYGYTAFCKAANLNPIPLESYERIELKNFLGWFYTATESKMLLDNSDTIVYYRTEAKYPCYITVEDDGHKTYMLKYYGTDISAEKGYDVFIGKEKPVCRFETRSKGGSLLIIGDSSVHAFLPFLMPHYSEILFYNPSCFSNGDDYRLPEADAVLFMSYATNANNSAYCDKLEGIS